MSTVDPHDPNALPDVLTIVEWLRKEAELVALYRLDEAADRIEFLEEENQALRAQLDHLVITGAMAIHSEPR